MGDYAKKHFKSTPILDFALEVEQLTTKKRANLILNVDGCIAVSFVDMIRSCGAFSREECDDLMAFGCLNGLFVLGRSIGFIGGALDDAAKMFAEAHDSGISPHTSCG